MIDKDVFVAIAIAGHPRIIAKSQELYELRNRALAKLIPESLSLNQHSLQPEHKDKQKMTPKKAKIVLENYLAS